MAVQYDPAVIVKFADKLYRRADSIVAAWCFMGFVGGGALAAVIANIGASQVGLGNFLLPGLIGAAFGTWLGYSIGSGRAFVYRLQAQQALCDVRIEQNTREAAEHAKRATEQYEQRAA